MEPVAAAFTQVWPEAVRMNLLDDRLSADMAQSGSLTPGLTGRIVALARYAKDWGAEAILYTCSAFGPAIDAAARHVELPTYKPNDAMFLEALGFAAAERPAKIGLISTFAPSVHSMREELLAAARERKLDVVCQAQWVSGALEALRAGDAAGHDRLIAEQAQTMADCDVVMLGQFSMARAQHAVARATGRPVLTSPHSAVRLLQSRLATTE
jgi:Asp/Glu/hydantoin racemase